MSIAQETTPVQDRVELNSDETVHLQSLMHLATIRSPQERAQLAYEFAAPFVDERGQTQLHSSNGQPHSLEELQAALAWNPLHPRPVGVGENILALSPTQRAELLRECLVRRAAEQSAEADAILGQLSEEFLEAAIRVLEDVPVPIHSRKTARWSGSALDLPEGATPSDTRLHRALTALLRQREREKQGAGEDVEPLRNLTRDFVLAMLNPRTDLKLIDITDVYGTEKNVPSPNDATPLRVATHWQEVERRYGVNIDVIDQGTHIAAPEQCGFYALAAVNQARRANRSNARQSTTPRFFALNNAARIASHDGIDGAEGARSSALLYFTFDVGDGILHHGVAYGDSTLTHLKPYLVELYEIEGTEQGTQFRSLEFEKHIATVSSMADGILPLCYGIKRRDIGQLPELNLEANEAQFIGVDKYGNGLTSLRAEDLFAQLLPAGQTTTRVKVTFLDRQKNPTGELICTLARSLGLVRDGNAAIWESSTPTSQDPTRGHASIGAFKEKPDDIARQVVDLTPGSLLRFERIDE